MIVSTSSPFFAKGGRLKFLMPEFDLTGNKVTREGTVVENIVGDDPDSNISSYLVGSTAKNEK